MKELLIINAGNTHIETLKIDLQKPFDWQKDPAEYRKVFSPREFEEKWQSLSKGCSIAASSVVPQWTLLFKKSGAFIVSKDIKYPFSSLQMDMKSVGADRIANAAALTEGALPAICIDFGTAITFETLEGNGAFTGGAILPGRKLLRQALHDHTALLPLVPLTSSPSLLPEGTGKNTADAILLGTDRACIGAVKEVLEGIRNDLEKKYPGCKIRICACGGDRKFFLEKLSFMEEAPFHTLRGIYCLWKTACASEKVFPGENEK